MAYVTLPVLNLLYVSDEEYLPFNFSSVIETTS